MLKVFFDKDIPTFCITLLRKPQKKVLFLVARPLRPLAPPPLGLVAIGTFSLHSLVTHPFSPPPLLVARPLGKELFAASLNSAVVILDYLVQIYQL